MAEKQMLCTSCEIYILGDYKEHFVSDFHKYNCKRKIALLPPITKTEFDVKLKALAKRTTSSLTFDCKLCKKTFDSEHLYNAHLGTKKHLKKEHFQELKKQPKQEKVSTLDNINACLYCLNISTDFEESLTHLFNFHGFDIPYKENVTDKKEIIKLIGRLIYKEHRCVQCDTAAFKSTKAVLSHIKEKRHYHLNVDLYESDYIKLIKDMKLFKTSRTPFSQRILMEDPTLMPTIGSSETTSHKYSESREEDEWEEEEEEEEEDDKMVGAKDKKEQPTKEPENELIQFKQDYIEPLLLMNGNLMLSDGRIVGNKMYQQLYKKNMKIDDNRPEIKIGKEYIHHRPEAPMQKFVNTQKTIQNKTNGNTKNFMKSLVRLVPKPQI